MKKIHKNSCNVCLSKGFFENQTTWPLWLFITYFTSTLITDSQNLPPAIQKRETLEQSWWHVSNSTSSYRVRTLLQKQIYRTFPGHRLIFWGLYTPKILMLNLLTAFHTLSSYFLAEFNQFPELSRMFQSWKTAQ